MNSKDGGNVVAEYAQSSIDFPRNITLPIMALMFLSGFPMPKKDLQIYRFILLELLWSEKELRENQAGKLNCFLHFFKRGLILQNESSSSSSSIISHQMKSFDGRIRISRRALIRSPSWKDSNKSLCHVTLDISGLIDKSPDYCYRVDFANRVPGGGAFTHGCVQEEILFMTMPELCMSTLLCEWMNDNEAILVEGAEKFNRTKGLIQFVTLYQNDLIIDLNSIINVLGYSRTFDFAGDYQDQSIAQEQILPSKLIIIDALCFKPQSDANQHKWQPINPIGPRRNENVGNHKMLGNSK
ncbi:MAG: hypothetical protein EZS28_036459 [Streblomastix strix]|uniref:PARG catalytic Macro domain-containing protein n=1 Tax=Streblomastix strix TaxID=222440 RepID=A0A5J4UCQ5_9EUKA|nr:MAG: hypothetical protein EZS28_036459 [Streblomastix strix]